jgi:chromosome segregation ATPase
VEQAKAQIAKEQRDALESKKERVKSAAVQVLKNIAAWKQQIATIETTIQMAEESLIEMSADPIKYHDENLCVGSTSSRKKKVSSKMGNDDWDDI